MQRIKNFNSFNESSSPIKVDEELILQSIGILTSPRNEIFGTPERFSKDTTDSQTLIPILKSMLKGGEPTQQQMDLLKPLLGFVYMKKTSNDDNSKKWLDTYRKEGEKQSGVVWSGAKEIFSKRKKAKLF